MESTKPHIKWYELFLLNIGDYASKQVFLSINKTMLGSKDDEAIAFNVYK
jgi:hypothetical protein